MTKEFKTCKIDFDAFDSHGNLVISERNVESATYTIKYDVPGEYKVTFYNGDVASTHNQKEEKHLSVGYECYWCGKVIKNPDDLYLNKDTMKQKIDRIQQIQGIIGAIMMLTTNSKRIVANFTSSNRRLTRHYGC